MKRFLSALAYAVTGIVYAFKNEKNFRIEIFCGIAACLAGFLFDISSGAWMLILLNIGIVLSAELFNTAVERLSDLYSPAINPVIKIIKDAAAAAVLISAVIAAVCAGIVFIPAVIHFIKNC